MRPNSPIRTAILGLMVLSAMAGTAFARSVEPIFTIAKYPVEATGTNAVTAKRDALGQGRRSAFRSLLKRLVPAAAYSQIEHLKKLDPEPYIGSVRVRAEENSSTQYIATLDFSFEPEAVRKLLGQHGVTYVDRPAPATSLLLLYSAPKTGAPKAMSGPKGWGSWRRVWADLDLANSLTPLKLERKPADLAPDAVKALLAAEPTAIASLGDQFKSPQVIVAEARPDPASNELHVTLAGQDAVGRFAVTTRYRLDDDFVYSLELAAVIAQGVLEGRWKARMASSQVNKHRRWRDGRCSDITGSPGGIQQSRTMATPATGSVEHAGCAQSADWLSLRPQCEYRAQLSWRRCGAARRAWDERLDA